MCLIPVFYTCSLGVLCCKTWQDWVSGFLLWGSSIQGAGVCGVRRSGFRVGASWVEPYCVTMAQVFLLFALPAG